MPRKTSKPGSERGGGHVTGEATRSETFVESYDPNSLDQNDLALQTTTPVQRGEPPTRGNKRRRISNNVSNSTASHGIYGSGTIVASNPFDDDFPQTTDQVNSRASMVENKTGVISKHSPNQLPLSSHYQTGPPAPHPANQQQVYPLHPSHQMQQQQNQQQAFDRNPDERLQQRDLREPLTSTPYLPYHGMNPISRNHAVPSDLMNLPAQPPAPLLHPPPPSDLYAHNNSDTVMQGQPPSYDGSNNLLAYCRRCHREIYPGEPSIVCEASCRTYFHSACSGLTQLAYEMLMQEGSRAEWACDDCTSTDWQVPLVKYKH